MSSGNLGNIFLEMLHTQSATQHIPVSWDKKFYRKNNALKKRHNVKVLRLVSWRSIESNHDGTKNLIWLLAFHSP